MSIKECSWKPIHDYYEPGVNAVLSVADSYYKHREQFIYSGGGDTFLSGGHLTDPKFNNRGNIDCSTFIHLILLGIDYEHSPYVSGTSNLNSYYSWADQELLERLKAQDRIRHAHELARYFWDRGECFQESRYAMPGDLVFYQAAPSRIQEYFQFQIFHAIAHVGILIEPGVLLHATGFQDKSKGPEKGISAIEISNMTDRRRPVFYARPYYGGER